MEKEKAYGTKLAGLKTSIATRIIRLYREGLRQFPHDERFWNNYIEFSKKSVPHEVLGIYEKMLTVSSLNYKFCIPYPTQKTSFVFIKLGYQMERPHYVFIIFLLFL